MKSTSRRQKRRPRQMTELAIDSAGASTAPEVLLLDDPLRNVDAKLRYEMRLDLRSLLRRARLWLGKFVATKSPTRADVNFVR